MSAKIKINNQECVGCGMCVKDCPNDAIRIRNGKAKMVLEHCLECGHCIAICPKAAVSMDGYNMEEIKEYQEENFKVPSDNFLNSIKFRRSVRHFESLLVEHEKIERMIEAGRYTPTAINKQSTRYIVMENPDKGIEKDAIQLFRKVKVFADAAGRVIRLPIDTRRYKIEKGFFFHGAPIVVLVISDSEVDAALASANMEMMAQTMGLGVLYAGFFVKAAQMSKRIRKKLGLKKKEKVVTAIAIGYPTVHYKRTVPRKKAKVQWQ